MILEKPDENLVEHLFGVKHSIEKPLLLVLALHRESAMSFQNAEHKGLVQPGKFRRSLLVFDFNSPLWRFLPLALDIAR